MAKKDNFGIFFLAAVCVGFISIYGVININRKPYDYSSGAEYKSSQIEKKSRVDGGLSNSVNAFHQAFGRAENPADFAVKPSDFGGHPAFNQAMMARVCEDYFRSKKDQDQDMADAAQLERSGIKGMEGIVKQTQFKIQVMEVQCQNVTQSDIAKAGALLREAAAAGDRSAQSIVLQEDFRAADARRIKDKAEGRTQEDSAGQYKHYLDGATQLAKEGDAEAALLAGKLTLSSVYGQRDIGASASWMLVGLQNEGRPFDERLFPFDSEPYSDLSPSERQSAVERARAIYAECCSRGGK